MASSTKANHSPGQSRLELSILNSGFIRVFEKISGSGFVPSYQASYQKIHWQIYAECDPMWPSDLEVSDDYAFDTDGKIYNLLQTLYIRVSSNQLFLASLSY